MNINKMLLASLAGGVAYFLLGWLVWGILLVSVWQKPDAETMNVISKEPMVMWSMIVSCLAYGALIAYIFGRWAGISTFVTGAKAGAIIGALASVWINLSMFSMYSFITMQNTILDVVASAIITAIIGGVIGWVLGSGKK